MKIVSLFSGIGGLDQGFEQAGFDVIWANDFDKYAVQTYQANFDSPIMLGDINAIPLEDIPDYDAGRGHRLFHHALVLPRSNHRQVLPAV